MRFLLSKSWIPIVLVEIEHIRDPHRIDYAAAGDNRAVTNQPMAPCQTKPLMVRGTGCKRAEAAERVRSESRIVRNDVEANSHQLRTPLLIRAFPTIRDSRSEEHTSELQ